MESTLRRFPNSLLGNPNKRKRYWNTKTNEYFFDRHRPRFVYFDYNSLYLFSFEAILHIYQTNGQVIRPESVPINLFLRELKFYEVSLSEIKALNLFLVFYQRVGKLLGI
jgi:hypothetical protein